MENREARLIKTFRLLSLYERLTKGVLIRKAEEAKRFGVDPKSIQRDIDDLRAYFQEPWAAPAALSFHRAEKGYRLDKQYQSMLSAPEILTIGKILLESRSLKKEAMNDILAKLAKFCEPLQAKHIQEVLRNEQHHYFAVRQGECLTERVWELSQAARDSHLVELTYGKEHGDQPVMRRLEPLGVVFSEYYFYLVANIHDKDYPYPAVYRIDRIAELKVLQETFHCPYTKRFEAGEFRKRIQFMKAGALMKIRFRFWGESPEAALDRFPNARVLKRSKGEIVIEAEVYGEGVVMWLLSQGEYLEVLEPKSLRETMKKAIAQMQRNYVD